MDTTQNPLLSKLKLPGRVFALPSKGQFYTNGELAPGVKDGEVHVHPLSALAEITLKTPDLLVSGKALDEVFAECVPEIRKPRELFGRDIDALLYYLRLVTYGPVFQVKVKHNCEEAKNHTYNVNIEEMVLAAKALDPTTAVRDFVVTLPNEQVVRVDPVRYDHVITLLQMNAGKKEFNADDVKRNVVMNLTALITSIDGNTDKNHIEGWVKVATSPMLNRVSEALNRTNEWGVSNTAKIQCRDCGEVMDVELPINPVDFFTE